MAMRSRSDIRNLCDIAPTGGVVCFDARVILAGAVTIGSVTIRLVELEAFRFVERSNQPGMKIWQHEREVVPTATGCALIDRLSFEPRMMTSISTWFVERLFEHRHRRLRKRWGGEQRLP